MTGGEGVAAVIAQLEAAEAGSRELDVLVDVARGREPPPRGCHWGKVEPYTTSLDAALTLVPDGIDGRRKWWNMATGLVGVSVAEVRVYGDGPDPVRQGKSAAYSPALALSAAALRALAAQVAPGGEG